MAQAQLSRSGFKMKTSGPDTRRPKPKRLVKPKSPREVAVVFGKDLGEGLAAFIKAYKKAMLLIHPDKKPDLDRADCTFQAAVINYSIQLIRCFFNNQLDEDEDEDGGTHTKQQRGAPQATASWIPIYLPGFDWDY